MMVDVADNEQPNHPAPYDPERQRQFEQFQQFQQFLQYQETQGQLPPAAVPPPPKAPKGKPWWMKVLRSRLFYRLLGLIGVIAAVAWGCTFIRETLNPATKDDGLGVQGGAGPGQQSDPGKEPGKPNEVLYTLYQNISLGMAPQSCYLFDKQGAAQFAANYGEATCDAAVRKLKPSVALLEKVPRIEANARQTIVVSSCTLAVKAGTTSLGTFTFTPLGTAWIISGHELTECPKPTTASTVPTTASTPTSR